MTTLLDRLVRYGWSLALASVLAVSACKPQDGAKAPDRSGAASELQAVLDEVVAAGVPGISAAVATRAGVVWTGVAGMADIQAGTPVRPDMLFGRDTRRAPRPGRNSATPTRTTRCSAWSSRK